jgi:hypothetical protein
VAQQIELSAFTQNFFYIFEETFAVHHNIYLESGSALIPTLDGITAAEASIRVGGKCGSLAAQVAHLTQYMEAAEHMIRTGEDVPTDYSVIWKTVEKVDEAEWQRLKDKLKTAYERIHAMLSGFESWHPGQIGGALIILVHSTYHLGEIRQALCTLR